MSHRKDVFSEFYNNIIRLSLILLLFFALFGIFRISLLSLSEDATSVLSKIHYLLPALYMGFRFDAVCIFFGLTPIFVVYLLGLLFYGSKKYINFSRRFSVIYSTIMFLLMLFILVVDFFFYQYFRTHIDLMVFGFWEDNTAALMKTFWTDYPIILIFLGVLIFVLIVLLVLRRIMSLRFSVPKFKLQSKICIAVLVTGLFFWGARGFSLGFPIRMMHAELTPDTFINSMIPNGVFAFKTAIQDKRKQEITPDLEKVVKESGFPSIDAAVGYYVNHPVKNNETSLIDALIAETPENPFLKENPPHIVFILMEGFGTHLLSFHDKEKLNLTGELEDVLPDAYFFKNFVSATQGTINSLEAIMINNYFKTAVAQSSFSRDSLTSSVAYVLKQAGYGTNFVSSAMLGWRNLNRFIPNQYFDHLIGAQDLENKYPGAEANDWGCYDEYMFDYIAELLDKNSACPQFIFGLTTTNHTPFKLPTSYLPYPIDITLTHRKTNFDDEIARLHFTTYQYANDKLGKLIKRIKSSKYGDKTIIAVTGDHAVRGLFNYGDSEMLDQYGVPFLLFVPDKYKPEKNIDMKNFGSHKDIFPTLFNLSLSQVKYLKSGVDLFSDEANNNFAYHLSGITFSKNGCVNFTSGPTFYTWNNNGKLAKLNNKANESLQENMNKAKALTACMNFFNQTEWKKQNK